MENVIFTMLMDKIEIKQITELAKRLRTQKHEDELMFRIFDEINILDEREQAALGMRYIAGKDYVTIANVLDTTVEDSKKLAQRALLQLKQRVFGKQLQ